MHRTQGGESSAGGPRALTIFTERRIEADCVHIYFHSSNNVTWSGRDIRLLTLISTGIETELLQGWYVLQQPSQDWMSWCCGRIFNSPRRHSTSAARYAPYWGFRRLGASQLSLPMLSGRKFHKLSMWVMNRQNVDTEKCCCEWELGNNHFFSFDARESSVDLLRLFQSRPRHLQKTVPRFCAGLPDDLTLRPAVEMIPLFWSILQVMASGLHADKGLTQGN